MGEELLFNSLFAQLIMLGIIVAINFLTPVRFMGDFYKGFRFYCTALSNKVNKPQRSNFQQTIAGFVALIITLAPIIIILWLFADFVEVTWLYQGFLLWLALGWHQTRETSKKIATALKSGQKELAKEHLKPWVLRETRQLSSVGLTKATIEMHTTRAHQQFFNVIFYFLLVGPLFALSYRLILEMHYSWNNKYAKFRFFGATTTLLNTILQWLPCRLMTVFMLLTMSGKHFILFWRLLSREFSSEKSTVLIHCHALNLGVKLSSPVIYLGQKIRRPIFNDKGRQPEPQDIERSLRQLEQVFLLPSLLLMIMAMLSIAPELMA